MDGITRQHAPYPAIDPSRPELSQKGRAVLITGSSSGIGFYIARAFAKAKASTVVLTGRQQNSVAAAVEALAKDYPDTKVVGKTLDFADPAAVKQLWNGFEKDGLLIDVLALSAARIQFEKASLLKYGYAGVSADLAANVGSNLQFIEHFYYQKSREPSIKLNVVNVSTFSIHNFEVNQATPSYGLSKNAAALTLQLLAMEVPVSDMQIVSFHPGFIFTNSAKQLGYTDPNLPWDHDDLPGHYAVWTASDEAAFLHGRYTYTEWDVTELQSGKIREKIDNDPKFLKLGMGGL
ncbi:hypothetical protein F4678DRAFT_288118 [Xylaria arbuscula]|nr:hypothetical protein F4678DRAFT_288118 [Xylaria arbuscula]